MFERRRLVALVVATLAGCASHARAQPAPLGLGRPASPAQIAAARDDIGPNGNALPTGAGTAVDGERVFASRCARCHESGGIALAGGIGSLASSQPYRSVGSFWPYATTLFDYIARAMPPPPAARLSPDDLYAVTAFVLAINGIVGPHEALDRSSLPHIVMPNANGFASPPP